MTGRALAIAAAGALTVATLAVAVGPLLSDGSHVPVATPVATPAHPAIVSQVAQRAARADLRCPTSREPQSDAATRPAGCGTLHVTRRQTSCSTPARCTVDLIGDIHPGRRLVPVALTVTVIHAGSGWQVREVRS
jgi:hypothetical protein